jgi:hypothetical protein
MTYGNNTHKKRILSLSTSLFHYGLYRFPISFRLLLITLSPLILLKDHVRLYMTSNRPTSQKTASSTPASQVDTVVDKADEVESKGHADFSSISDIEYDSLLPRTKKIALLTWKQKESIPSGFLSHPEYRERYLAVEEIYRQLENEPGVRAQESDKNVTIKDIQVDWDLAMRHDYVVENPSAPGTAQYLDQDEFTRLQNTCITTKKYLRILSYPGINKPSKFPPRTCKSYRTRWLNLHAKEVQPFIYNDSFSWASFINPVIAKPVVLLKTPPSQAHLSPKSPITKATGQIVRYWSTLQSICSIYSLPAELSWCLVTLGLEFQSLWYYSSLAHSCNVFKESKRLTLKYLAGTPELVTTKVRISIDKHGLPRLIPDYIRLLIRQNHELAIKVVLLGLDTPKMFVYLGSDNSAPIVSTSTASPSAMSTIIENKGLIAALLSAFTLPSWRASPSVFTNSGLASISKLSNIKLFFTSKAGPNGHALLSAMLDAVALLDSPALPAIKRYIKAIKHDAFYDYMIQVGKISRGLLDSMYCFLTSDRANPLGIGLDSKIEPVEGRISRVYTAYGKCRLIAIPSYFVQVLFKPIHLCIFEILRLIPTDSTFDQEGGVRRIVSVGGDRLRSFDLSSATDRLPLHIQVPVVFVLACICGLSPATAEELSSAWAEIIRKTQFTFANRTSGKIRTLNYNCGHPMGTYSSWAVFTLTHHILVQICAFVALVDTVVPIGTLLTGVNMDEKIPIYKLVTQAYRSSYSGIWYTAYQMLGDDVVFFARNEFEVLVSDLYLAFMPLLGVEIHPSKGFDSHNASFEFAKMFMRKGIFLNSIRWGEWAGVYQPGVVATASNQALDRGFKLTNFDCFLQSVINLLPYTIKEKRKYENRLSQLLVGFCKPTGNIDVYLLSLLHTMTHSTYQVAVDSWVSWCMGATQIPSSRPPCKAYDGEYKRIGVILSMLRLILKGTDSRLFAFSRTLDISICSTLFTFLKRRAFPPDTGESTWPKLSRWVFSLVRTSSKFCAMFVTHPALRVMYESVLAFDPKNTKDLDIGYDLLEYSPEKCLDIEENIKSSDAKELDKTENVSFHALLHSFSLMTALLNLYHKFTADYPEEPPTEDSLDFNIQGFVNSLRPLKVCVHSVVEERVRNARLSVRMWVPSNLYLLPSPAPYNDYLECIYGVEKYTVSKKPAKSVTHLKPLSKDILEYDILGVTKFQDPDLVADATEALRTVDVETLSAICSDTWCGDVQFGTPFSSQEVVDVTSW